MRRCVLALLLLAALAACATTPRLRADVEAFSALDGSPAPAEVAITPFGPIDAGNLEFRTYRDRLARALDARGFEVVPADREPRFRMALGYRVGEGRQIVETDPTGPRALPRRHYDARFADPYAAFPQLVTYTVYARHVVLVLTDTARDEEVWRASAVNFGRRPTLEDVVAALIEAALATFPEGGTRSLVVSVPPAG